MLFRKTILLLIVGCSVSILNSQSLVTNDPFAGGTYTVPSTGQQKSLLSLDECFQAKNNPSPPPSFRWKGNDAFTLFSSDTLWEYSTVQFNQTLYTKKSLISKDSMFQLLSKALGIPASKFNRFPTINWISSNRGWFIQNGALLEISETLAATTTHGSNFKLSIKSKFGYNASKLQAQELATNNHWLAYVSEDNIYVQQLEGWTEADNFTSTVHKVTTDGGNGIVYGQSVHQNEFGITKGLFWSKNAAKLAFYRMDERRVPNYPLIDIGKRPAAADQFRYPMAGDSSHTVTVGIFDPLSKKLIYLKTEGTYDHYLTNLTFTPDEKYLYISWVNREQNRMELRKYSTETGLLVSVDFTLSHPKYVEPENGPIFLPNSNTNFILEHEGSGYNHLYLFEFTKENMPPKITPITQGNWEVTQFLGFADNGINFIYQSTEYGPLDRNYYWGYLPSGKSSKSKKSTVPNSWLITNHGYTQGTNTGILSPKGDKIAIYHTDLITPMGLGILNCEPKSNAATNAIFLHTSKNPLENYAVGEILLQKQSFNGVDLYSRTIYPYNFDPSKKYPVVVYVYGGPHAQMVTNSWLGGGSLWMHFLASKGYVVYTIDNRGSAHRGLEFENVTHKKLGEIEMQDQLAALRWLKQQTWVDSNRVGIHGWSFGGFMTTSLMTKAAGNYKVGVAGGPVINWNYYEIMYTERYMDRPQENPNGFAETNLVNQAKNLKDRLLMIHGADDNVVVWQHSLMFLNACVKASNANLDYFVYPGHKHNVVGPDRAHLYKKVCQYFFDHL